MNLKSIVKYTVFALIILAVFMAGYITAKSIYKKELNTVISGAEKFFPPIDKNIKYVNGKVVEVSGNYIKLESYLQNRFPWEERKKVLYTVAVSDDTSVLEVDPSVIPEIDENGLPVINVKNISLSSIKSGDKINVVSDENILGKNKFKAVRIEKNIMNDN